jgi:hypothetical protein
MLDLEDLEFPTLEDEPQPGRCENDVRPGIKALYVFLREHGLSEYNARLATVMALNAFAEALGATGGEGLVVREDILDRLKLWWGERILPDEAHQ